MHWSEVDLKAMVWTVPAGRIKAGKEHRVALTPEAAALLGEPRQPVDLVFEGQMKPGRPLSDATLAAVLKRMKRGDIKGGHRGSARPPPQGQGGGRIRPGDLFQKRRLLMR